MQEKRNAVPVVTLDVLVASNVWPHGIQKSLQSWPSPPGWARFQAWNRELLQYKWFVGISIYGIAKGGEISEGIFNLVPSNLEWKG